MSLLRNIFKLLTFTMLRYRLARKAWYSLEGQLVRYMTSQVSSGLGKNRIVVLGRGLSLGHFSIASPDITDAVLVNFQDQDLRDHELKNELANHSLHIVGNIEEPTLPISQLRNMKIGDVYFCRPDVAQSHDYGQKRTSFGLSKYGRSVKYFPSELAEGFAMYGNAGLLAIYLAVAHWQASECTLFGFDFYETDYLSQSLIDKMGSGDVVDAHREAGVRIKSQLLDLITRYPNTNFRIYTYAEIPDPPANLSVELLSQSAAQ